MILLFASSMPRAKVLCVLWSCVLLSCGGVPPPEPPFAPLEPPPVRPLPNYARVDLPDASESTVLSPTVDRDQDGITDDNDLCPDDPEDKDGFQDEDGCPDPDNDSDGTPDSVDQCVNQPGNASSSGCPTASLGPPPSVVRGAASLKGTRLELGRPVLFQTNKEVLRPESYPILDDVVAIMLAVPTLVVEVQGHSDSRGSRAFNIQLTQSRAQAVMDYLVQHGIAANRLSARGYADTRPITHEAAQSSKNRRIEFVVQYW